jgi:hypothetical protein
MTASCNQSIDPMTMSYADHSLSCLIVLGTMARLLLKICFMNNILLSSYGGCS